MNHHSGEVVPLALALCRAWLRGDAQALHALTCDAGDPDLLINISEQAATRAVVTTFRSGQTADDWLARFQRIWLLFVLAAEQDEP